METRNPTEQHKPRAAPGESETEFFDFADPEAEAATGYALEHDVTPEQAAEIIRWQAETNEAVVQLREALGDRWVNAEFVHPDDGLWPGEAGLIVYVVSPTSVDIQLLSALRGNVRIETAISGRSELDDVVDSYMQGLLADGSIAADEEVGIRVKVDPATGQVSHDIERVLPDARCLPNSEKKGGVANGGRPIAFKKPNDGCGTAGCTSGFGGRMGTRQGVSIASHCMDSDGIRWLSSGFVHSDDSNSYTELRCHNVCGNWYAYAAMRPHYRDRTGDDVGFVRERYASTDPTSEIHVVGRGFLNVWGYQHDPSVPISETTVCKSASRFAWNGPGQYCGEVDRWRAWKRLTNKWTAVDWFPNSGVGGGNGSSGGPWYRAHPQAGNVIGMGIHHGTTSSGTLGWYERIGPTINSLNNGANTRFWCDHGTGRLACTHSHP